LWGAATEAGRVATAAEAATTAGSAILGFFRVYFCATLLGLVFGLFS